MSFYSQISPYYDEIFPVDQHEVDFVKGKIAGCTNVLDIGCGTGNITMHLAESGRKIIGVDGDAAMIAEANRSNSAPGVEYLNADMRGIGGMFPPASFDAIICLGNSLVHLTHPDEITAMISSVASLLKSGGSCIIQILNYDRILGRRKLSLPILETDNIHFSRFYTWQGEEMHFVTNLLIKKTGQAISNDIPLYPLRKGSLAVMLDQASLKETQYFGSYQGEAFKDDSFTLIALAKKEG